MTNAIAVETTGRTIAPVVDVRPWGVYGRISKRKEGDGAGAHVKIDRQLDEGENYVRWRINPDATIRRYSDNMSGWDPRVVRPDWERMMRDVARGELAGIVGWVPDRFTRQPRQQEDAFDAVKAGDAEMHFVSKGRVTSRLELRIMAAIAADESDIKSMRGKMKHEILAEQGTPPGGRRRFGYEPSFRATDENPDGIRQDEAEVIRDVAARVLRGESLASIARMLVRDGVQTPEGGTWTGQNVRAMILRPHLAALRSSKGVVVGPATWAAILDETTHYNLVSKLSDPSRRTSYTNARTYLLAGLATCHECGASLRGRPQWKYRQRGQEYTVYVCSAGSHCQRSVEQVDAAIERAMIKRLSRIDASGALIDEDAEDDVRALETEDATLVRKLDTLTTRNLDGRLSDDQLDRSTRAIETRRDAIRGELVEARAAVVAPAVALDGFVGPDVDAAKVWNDPRTTLAAKRGVIAYLTETVALRRAPNKGKSAFDPARDLVVRFADR